MTQATALEILKTGTNVFLTGEPGSGKTYLINQYIRYLHAHDMKVAITASTGIAATHISGVTIHSWSGIGIRKTLTKRDLDYLTGNERLFFKIRGTHVLIIDEVSMLEAGTLDLVEQVCRTMRGRPEPFGGLQVVLVGDFFQLPPVSKSDEPSEFAFRAASWSNTMFEVCYLTEQHRQSDAALSRVLTDIRGSTVAEETTGHLTSRRVAHHDDQAVATKLYTHNADVDRINADKLAKIEGETKVFVMKTEGPKAKVETLVRGCLSPEQLELKIGAAVMCTRNNPELGFVNGTLGTIVDFDKESGFPIIKTRPGRMITIPPSEWAIEEGETVSAFITQIPLRLAWAITVHKSQGMSLDAAVMDLTQSFAYGQGYVALSRVRTLAGLHLLGWNERALMIDPAIQEHDVLMRQQSIAADKAWATLPEDVQLERQLTFIKACGGKINPRRTKVRHEKVDAGGSSDYMERLGRIREKYPQAYMPWTEADDTKLTELYSGETSVKKIVDIMQRQPGAIRSRLKHLGITG